MFKKKIMELARIKNRNVFRRIGNYYGGLFDSDHFMGRSALQDSWIAPKNKTIDTKDCEVNEIELHECRDTGGRKK